MLIRKVHISKFLNVHMYHNTMKPTCLPFEKEGNSLEFCHHCNFKDAFVSSAAVLLLLICIQANIHKKSLESAVKYPVM